MDNTPSQDTKDNVNQSPEAEVLQPRSDNSASTAASPSSPAPGPLQAGKKPRRRGYRPSHKATFIGLAAVLAILAINAGVIQLVLKKQAKNDDLTKKGQVSISTADLNKLGINRSLLGDSGVELIVAPNAQFKGKLSVTGDTSLSGNLLLNSKLIATDASFTQLQGGKVSLSELDVNGNSTLSSLNLRKELIVAGQSQLQGPVTIYQLLTVSNNVNITGNLAIGGVLTVNTFSARSLTSTSTLSIGGHIITSGPAPSVGAGSALGSNGTVSISGNDAAGSVAMNIGVGASSGTLANVAFRNQYGNLPRVVITPVGVGANFYLTNLSAAGFTINVASGLPPGGYRIDYIAMQ